MALTFLCLVEKRTMKHTSTENNSHLQYFKQYVITSKGLQNALLVLQNDPWNMVPNGTFLVGDTAYGLESYMMTPYKDTGNLNKKLRYVIIINTV